MFRTPISIARTPISIARTVAGTRQQVRNFGSSLKMNSAGYVDLGNPAILEFGNGSGNDNPFSFSYWTQITQFNVNNIYLGKSDGNVAQEWHLRNPGGALDFKIFNTNGAAFIGRRVIPFSNGKFTNDWVHIVGTYSGSKANSGIKIYINGVQADNSDVSSGSYTGMVSSAVNNTFGAGLASNTAFLPSSAYQDDYRLFNRALTLADVQSLYYGTAQPAGLVGWWKLDENTGTNAADSSGNGNAGTLSGSPVPTWSTNVFMIPRTATTNRVSDTFIRANSTSTLGSTDTGQVWTVGNNGDAATLPTWGISSNKGYEPNAGNKSDPHAWVESNLSDAIINCNVTVSPAVGSDRDGIVFRRQDANNMFFAHLENGAQLIAIQRNLAGVRSVVSSTALTIVNNQTITLQVVLLGSSIQVYADGVLKLSYTDSNMVTATKHGIESSNATAAARFSNFTVSRSLP